MQKHMQKHMQKPVLRKTWMDLSPKSRQEGVENWFIKIRNRKTRLHWNKWHIKN